VEQPRQQHRGGSVSDAGFDWILFDTEHSPNEIPDVLGQLQAAERGSASLIVRPAWNDAVLIKRVLDIGAQSVLVPYVQNAEEARRAVASVRYPPAGILTTNEDEARRYIDWGYTFVAVGSDVGLLVRSADALAKKFKAG
jgi:2-keto-3-deoxy-L-rhamnonate aldolase RhmA